MIKMQLKSTVNMDSAKAKVLTAYKQGLVDSGEYILQESMEIVPLDEGTLLRSGEVTSGEKGGNFEVHVSYDTKYANKLHGPNAKNYKFQNNRQNNYLGSVFDETKDKIAAYVKDAVKKVTG